jgi:cytidylate kinase
VARSKPSTITIDGPVASGKSAVGGAAARRLGYRFIDTGVMYRAATCAALDRNIAASDESAVAALARAIAMSFEPGPPKAPEQARVLVDGVDLTERLRSAEIGEAVSLISRVPAVREAMVALQRKLAAEGHTIMAGRDIGTVVLPDAPLKVYLDATAAERARRRFAELKNGGRETTLEAEQRELALRDEIDSARDVSPLRPAADAVIIHTDGLSLEEVVERILELARCS